MKTLSFTEKMTGMVRRGIKTQTRRPVKGQPKYDVGEIVCINGNKNELVKITCVMAERLQDITVIDVTLEGFCLNEEFVVCWDSIYGLTVYQWEENPYVWVYDLNNTKKASHNNETGD